MAKDTNKAPDAPEGLTPSLPPTVDRTPGPVDLTRRVRVRITWPDGHIHQGVTIAPGEEIEIEEHYAQSIERFGRGERV